MHGVWVCPVIFEYDPDGVTDFASHERTENSEMLPFSIAWLERRERAIGVFAINRLAIDMTDSVATRRDVVKRNSLERSLRDSIFSLRHIIAVDLVSCDVVETSVRPRLR